MTENHALPRINSFQKVRSPLLLLILSIGFFFFCDNAIFRSGFYANFSNPFTSPSILFFINKFEKTRAATSDKTVLLLGNSQISSGFSISDFKANHPNSGITFVPEDINGTHEKAWYYMLRQVDPDHRKYSAIVLPLSFYQAPGAVLDQENDYETVLFITPIMPLRDWPDLIGSFTKFKARYRAAIVMLANSHSYSMDLQDFLSHPLDRFGALSLVRRKKEEMLYDGGVLPQSLEGLAYDASANHVTCPPQIDRFECARIDALFQPLPAADVERYTVRNSRYFSFWLKRIADMYRGSPTKLIFIQMPRWPLPHGGKQILSSSPDIRDFLPKRDNIVIVDPGEFEPLENPRYFHDMVHLDTEGRHIFSKRFSDIIIDLVAGGSAADAHRAVQ